MTKFAVGDYINVDGVCKRVASIDYSYGTAGAASLMYNFDDGSYKYVPWADEHFSSCVPSVSVNQPELETKSVVESVTSTASNITWLPVLIITGVLIAIWLVLTRR